MALQYMYMPLWWVAIDLIPFSPVHTMIPQVFLNRVSHHNYNTWLEESLTKFPQTSITLSKILASKHKAHQKDIHQRKVKTSL